MRTLIALALLISTATGALAQKASLVPSVESALDQAQSSLATGRDSEAQAYAESLLFPRDIVCATEGHHASVDRALNTWSSTLGVEFRAGDARTADLRILFRPFVQYAGRKVMGLASIRRSVRSWSYDTFTYRVSGTIEISTTDPFGVPVGEDVLTSVVLHEVGHFLGLEDTAHLGCAMGPVNLKNPVLEPSTAEIDALLGLRTEARAVLDTLALAARD